MIYINRMKRIISIIKGLIEKEPVVQLGRWNIDYCSKKTAQKIDLSNEDHCGTCGQYINAKRADNESDLK